jgi:hypothetical protein
MANAFDKFDSEESPRAKSRRLADALKSVDLGDAPAKSSKTVTDAERAKTDAAKAISDAEIARLAAEKARRAANLPEYTDAENKARSGFVLMKQGEKLYKEAVQKGYDPGHIKNVIANVAETIPGIGATVSGSIRDDYSRIGRQGELAFTEGYKRKLSGSAVGEKKEEPNMLATIFPQRSIFTPTKMDRAAALATRLAVMEDARIAGKLPSSQDYKANPEEYYYTPKDNSKISLSKEDQALLDMYPSKQKKR